MSSLSVTRRLGLILFAAVLASAALVSETSGQRTTAEPAEANTLEIILELDSADVAQSEPGSWLSVYMTNVLTEVGGFEISLLLSRPDLFNFQSDSAIETTIVCIDTLDCDPADTTIDTVRNTPVDTVGSVVGNWELIEGRAESAIKLKVIGIADQLGGATIPPIPTGGPHLLMRVYMEKIANDSLLDTLQDRTTYIFVDGLSTHFSNPTGQTIGRLDSTICLNPPTCDSLDTVFYNDTSAFVYTVGVRQFTSACLRGDLNDDGIINAADVIYLVNYVFKAGPLPVCSPASGDVTCEGETNAVDLVYLVNYVFKAGPPPLC